MKWRRIGPIDEAEKRGVVTFTQVQYRNGRLVFVEDWIGTAPSWWGLVLQMRALELPMPFVHTPGSSLPADARSDEAV